MHVDNELVEFVTADEQEYEKVIEEYEDNRSTFVWRVLLVSSDGSSFLSIDVYFKFRCLSFHTLIFGNVII